MATFGQLTNGANSSTSSGDSSLANKATDAASTPATDGILDAVIARIWIDSGSTEVRGAVWDASGNLLATGDEVILSNTTESEITLPFSGAQRIALVAGTKYNYGLIWDDPGVQNINWSRQTTAAASWKNSITYPTPDNPLGTGTVSGPIDMYVSYTESVSSAVKTINGLARASVKAWVGLAIASVKSVNGLQ